MPKHQHARTSNLQELDLSDTKRKANVVNCIMLIILSYFYHLPLALSDSIAVIMVSISLSLLDIGNCNWRKSKPESTEETYI